MNNVRRSDDKEPEQAAIPIVIGTPLKLFYSQQVNIKKWVSKAPNFPHMCKIMAIFKQPAVTISFLLR